VAWWPQNNVAEPQKKEDTVNKFIRMTVLVSVLFGGTWAFAQQQEQSPTELKAQIAAMQSRLNDQQAKEGEFVSKFAGFGKELGTAFNGFVAAMDGGLKVTTDRVNEFAQTDVGKFAMFSIGWKIFASDIGSIALSISNKTAGFVLLIVFCWLLKRTIEALCWGRMIVTKKEGPWWNRRITKERMTSMMKDKTIDNSVFNTWATISVVALIVIFITSMVGLTH
jgi:hypothetical protein